MFVFTPSSWLDFLGVQYGKWYYTGKVLPSIPSYVPWDWVILPVLVMTLIQFKPQISPILKVIIYAGVSTFIGEPLFLWVRFLRHKGLAYPLFLLYIFHHLLIS